MLLNSELGRDATNGLSPAANQYEDSRTSLIWSLKKYVSPIQESGEKINKGRYE